MTPEPEMRRDATAQQPWPLGVVFLKGVGLHGICVPWAIGIVVQSLLAARLHKLRRA